MVMWFLIGITPVGFKNKDVNYSSYIVTVK